MIVRYPGVMHGYETNQLARVAALQRQGKTMGFFYLAATE